VITIFDKIIDGSIDSKIVYEDNNWLAFLDIKPENPGHTILINKISNSENILDETIEIRNEFINKSKDITELLKSTLNASGFQLKFNCGADAGQEVFRTHMHIIPYYNHECDWTPEAIYKKIRT